MPVFVRGRERDGDSVTRCVLSDYAEREKLHRKFHDVSSKFQG